MTIGKPLDPITHRRLRRYVERVGENPAVAAFQITRTTLARALCGLPVRRATALLMRVQLDVLDRAVS